MQKFKTLFLLLAALAAFSFASDWTGSTSEPENTKRIGGATYYVITTAEELAWFAAQVNSGNTSINAQLANDIRFKDDTSKTSTVSWTPIGKDSTVMFAGIFDGAGRTISGLYSEQSKFAGLFGVTGTTSVVKDVNMHRNSIQSTGEPSYAGGVVAFNNGTISGCTNAGAVSSNSYSGGVVGLNNGTVSGCTNAGTVTSTSNYTSNISPYSGGIAAINSGTVLDCTNAGTVTSTSTSTHRFYSVSSYSGGVVAFNNGTVSGCTNAGTVTSTSNYTSTSNTYSVSSYSGGIVAINQRNVLDCKNGGIVSKKANYGGGIVAEDSVTGIVKNSFSYGDSARAGVIYTNNGTVTNSHYDSDVRPGLSTVAPNSGMTTAAMQKDQFAWVLNTTNGTEANRGVWSRVDGYPVFADSSHLPVYKLVFDDALGGTSNRYTNYKGTTNLPDDPEPESGHIFIGWFDANGNKVTASTVFTGDQTVTASYIEATGIYYTINFFNADSSLLESQSVQHGTTPAYAGETPTFAATAQYSYAFAGWHVEPTTATENFDYYATYTKTVNSYMVEFLDFDGSLLQSSSYLYGATPGYTGTLERTSTVAYDYSFAGWTPAIVKVSAAASYTALYDSVKVKYTVTFMDGASVFATVQVPYGETAVAPGTPTRGGFKFIGWSGSLSNVTSARTVSALFEELIYRKVFVYDEEGAVIDTVQVADEETFVLPEAPEKDGYTFDAWYDADGNRLGVAGDTVTISADTKVIPQYVKNASSSSAAKSSSSTAKSSSSSGAGKSSSSVAKSSSSSAAESSDSSEKGDGIPSHVQAPAWNLSVTGKTLSIFGAKAGTRYALFDMQGHVLRRGVVNGSEFSLDLQNAGVYIVRVGMESMRVRVK